MLIDKQVSLASLDNAASLIPKIRNKDTLCYYLADDYAHFIDLQEKLAGNIEIKNLCGLFNEIFQEIKHPLLELSAGLNKTYNSLEWWGSQVASKNGFSTPLLRNITYLFCAKKILSDSPLDIIFIVKSPALSDCISNVAMELGYCVKTYRNKISLFQGIIRPGLRKIRQIHGFFKFTLELLQDRRAAFRVLRPLSAKKSHANKRIVIRSWVNNSNFDKSGKFSDRNFGPLPTWLSSKNYEIWTLPMFLNPSTGETTGKKLYTAIKNQSQPFLIPHHYLKISDYLQVFNDSRKILKKRIENAEIRKTNVAPIINEAIKESWFVRLLFILNLCYPMLKRLKEEGFEIDGFYYSSENNSPEKQFILGCRKYFPDSMIIGFQHTAFFLNQLSYHLADDEKEQHPLPDKIVCSGPIYIELFRRTGFPSEILAPGANLRFGAVYMSKEESNNMPVGENKTLMLPLTFSHDLAFELFVKVNNALKDLKGYKVYIRSHPLLSRKTLIRFLNRIGMIDYEFADDGVFQQWLSKTYAVISTGGSITILEAVSMGTPVIRIVPDNTFFYDPFTWPDYPLEPVESSMEIRQQLQVINTILDNDKDAFLNIGKRVREAYFTKPSDENLSVFL